MITQEKSTKTVYGNPLQDKRLKGLEVVKSAIVIITPEIASEWLTRNKSNRQVKMGVVNNYVKQMQAGQWKENTGESIKFDDKGNLIDGQHRLHAIIRSGKSISMEVKTDMDWNTRKVIDTGTKRVAADLLAMEGYSNPMILAATAKFVLMFKLGKYSWAANNKGQSSQRVYVSNQDILKYVKDNSENLDEIIRDFQKTAKGFKYLTVSLMAGLYILYSEKSQRYAEEFFEKLTKGDSLSVTNPIFLLRERLIRDKTAKRKMMLLERLGLCVLAWNAFRESKKLASLVFNENEKFPRVI